MAGIEGLQQIEGLPSTNLTNDDAVGPQAETGMNEIANADLALAMLIRTAGLVGDEVLLLELKFTGIFNDDDALFGFDAAGKHI